MSGRINVNQLVGLLSEHFSREELLEVIFDLGINKDQFPAQIMSSLVRDIVQYCQRRGLLPSLLKVAKEKRPNAQWDLAIQEESKSKTDKLTDSAPETKSSPFYNQHRALTQIDYAQGTLVIISTLAGFGKTAILQKLKQDYESKEWKTAFIPLKSDSKNIGDVDDKRIMVATIEALGENYQEGDDIEDALYWAIPANKHVAILYDDVHLAELESIKSQFLPLFIDLLQQRTEGKFLVVFTGDNLKDRYWWSHPSYEYRYLNLESFKSDVIQNLLDSNISNARLSETLRQQKYRNWLVKRIVRLSGGHPRLVVQLLAEIDNGNWRPRPVPTRVEDPDRAIFSKHTAEEFARLTDGFQESYKACLIKLSVFRKADFQIINSVWQELEVKFIKDPFTLRDQLEESGFILKNMMDPTVRNVALAHLYFDDWETHRHSHQKARQMYEDLLETSLQRNENLETVESQIIECAYHLFSEIFKESNSTRMAVISSFLNSFSEKYLQYLSQNYATLPANALETLFRKVFNDEDISVMVQDYDIDVEALKGAI